MCVCCATPAVEVHCSKYGVHRLTAFGAVILKCALELFFHGAHSMHMPQNSFASGHAITIVSQGEWISDVLDLSPCTHLKSPVACANIWNKESLFWTLL